MTAATETARSKVGHGPDQGASPPASETATVVRTMTVIMGIVVGLTFLFGFGNVLSLALRLGVPAWVAPLVAPAVDLSILGLLIGTRHLALAGASPDLLRPARRLLFFASTVTLALNVAEPLVAGEYGKAAFDAVGPLLLIGWSEVGPGLVQAISSTTSSSSVVGEGARTSSLTHSTFDGVAGAERPQFGKESAAQQAGPQAITGRSQEMLLARARQEDAAHRAIHQKPISAETLRARLCVGATQARRLVKIVRSEFQAESAPSPG